MTATDTAKTTAAEKFAALVAAAAPLNTPECEYIPGKSHRTENDLFVFRGSERISREPVALIWENLSGRPIMSGAETRETLEDGLIFLARQAIGMYQEHGGTHHNLKWIVWNDGSRSWASVSWSNFGGESEPGTLYIGNGQASTYLTVRFEKETMRHPLR